VPSVRAPVPFRRRDWSIVELLTVSSPPDSFLERAVRVDESGLQWLKADPFAVRCEPRTALGQLKLVTALDGSGSVRQNGRHAILEEGTFTWVHSDAPFELTMTHGRRLIVRLPYDLVRQRHPNIDLETAVTRGHDHAGERVVADLLRRLAREGASLPDPSCAPAVNVILEAIGMCARTRTPDAARTRVERAIATIELRLGDPGLQPSDVARRQRVSRRYLDDLFEQIVGHTLAGYIRRRRLERAAHDLETRPDDLAAEIGTRWGFRDASHFTRIFRHRYAMTPSMYRRAHGACVAT
jgi:AraC-like DNA-binding protein